MVNINTQGKMTEVRFTMDSDRPIQEEIVTAFAGTLKTFAKIVSDESGSKENAYRDIGMILAKTNLQFLADFESDDSEITIKRTEEKKSDDDGWVELS